MIQSLPIASSVSKKRFSIVRFWQPFVYHTVHTLCDRNLLSALISVKYKDWFNEETTTFGLTTAHADGACDSRDGAGPSQSSETVV